MRENELMDVVECGVGAIVWRHEATAERLVQAVLAASAVTATCPPTCSAGSSTRWARCTGAREAGRRAGPRADVP